MTNPASAAITVLGLGPMGHALASAFLTAEYRTTVWNRTPGKAAALTARGAAEADSPAKAVAAGDVVVCCLRDYQAVQAVLDQVDGDWATRVLINLTSGEPPQARRMADWAGDLGSAYLDGAILSPTPTIGTSAATILYSGPSATFDQIREVVGALGGVPVYLGADPGRASGYDVALLDVFATSVHGIVHGFALASAEGISAGELAPFAVGIGSLLPEMITRFARQIDAGEYPGERSTIASAQAGLRHVRNAARQHDLDVGALTAALAAIDQAIDRGHGDQGLSRLVTVLRR